MEETKEKGGRKNGGGGIRARKENKTKYKSFKVTSVCVLTWWCDLAHRGQLN